MLLISGASGAGKTTVRTTITPHLGPPSRPSSCATSTRFRRFLTWRGASEWPSARWPAPDCSRTTAGICCWREIRSRRARCWPPRPPPRWTSRSACSTVTEDAQMERLRRRGEPEELLSRHVAFADWLRRHAQDPSHMPHVLTTDGWSAMRWSRLSEMGREQWRMTVIDGSARQWRKRVALCCNGLTTLWPVAHRCFAELFERWALPTSTEAGQHRPNYREDENVGSRDSADLCDRRPDQPDDDE